jgi:hypothetical protein
LDAVTIDFISSIITRIHKVFGATKAQSYFYMIQNQALDLAHILVWLEDCSFLTE